MIEAGAKEVKEDDMYEAIIAGQRELQPAIELIEKLTAKCPGQREKGSGRTKIRRRDR